MLQEHLSSLAKDNLPNQWALDFLTAEKGEACLFLNEECCRYINQPDQVEMKTKVQTKASHLQLNGDSAFWLMECLQ